MVIQVFALIRPTNLWDHVINVFQLMSWFKIISVDSLFVNMDTCIEMDSTVVE